MGEILQGLEGTLCLIDDILVFAKNEEEHKKRLSAVLQRIRKAGVTLNYDKCEFLKKEIKFLGHIINQDGIKADPEKTSAIAQMESPASVSELRRFLGMT